MFSGLTAWFSTSVSKCKKKLWLDNGGKEANVDEAIYLFSQDENSSDTLRIFESDAYIGEKLAVFHASYIRECIKLGDIRKGVLGKYFLPPKDIQEIGKKQKEYEWYRDGNLSDAGGQDPESDDEPRDNQPNNQSETTHKRASGIPVSSTNSKTSSMPQPGPSGLQAAVRGSPAKNNSTHSHDYRLGEKSSKVAQKTPVKQLKSNNHSNETVHRQTSTTKRKSPDKNEGSMDKRELKECRSAKKKRESGNVFKKGSCSYQEQEFLRIEDLAKITGELTDFVVGRNGCDLVDLDGM